MPLYETEDDRWQERVAAERFIRWTTIPTLQCFKRGGLPEIDCVVREGGRAVICFLEIKCRTNKSDKYPTWKVDLAKVKAARKLHAETGKDVFFVVRFWDRTGIIDAVRDEYKECRVWRNDKRDEHDNDPGAEYSTDFFLWI